MHNKPQRRPLLALAPATLHILLSLAGEQMHGYGIMQEVARQSNGLYKLGSGTLYDNLQRLSKKGSSKKRLPSSARKIPVESTTA